MKRENYKQAVDCIAVDKGLKERVLMNRRRRMPVSRKVLAVGVALVAMALVLTFAVGDDAKAPSLKSPNLSWQNGQSDGLMFSSFQVVAYAAGEKGAPLTGNYQEETEPTVMGIEVTVELPNYSPLMSSVPGLPFDIQFIEPKVDEVKPDTIEVTVDQGSLCTWDQVTFIVEEKGKEATIQQSTTLYWSPLGMDKDAEQSTMTVRMSYQGTEIDTQIIVIERLDDMSFTAKGK